MKRSVSILRGFSALLLVLGVASLSPSEAFGAAMTPHGSACPLHSGMQKALPGHPPQEPISHQCCAKRQNVAIPNAACNARPAVVCESSVKRAAPQRFSYSTTAFADKITSVSPPHSSPLRI